MFPFLIPMLVEKAIISNVIEIVSNIFTENVTPVAGSIAICKIAGGVAEHSGVYVGDGKFVELYGDGEIKKVNKSKFLNSGLLRTGTTIYIACDEYNLPISDLQVARRALKQVGKQRDYNLLMDNCHQFTAGCITGEFDNGTNFLTFLEDKIKKHMNYGERVKWLPADLD